MVTVTISLQLKRHIWHVVTCEVDSGEESQPLSLPGPHKRKFLSPEAASNYLTRLVLGRLKQQRVDATKADVACYVRIE
jgi:hypothetical protein